MRIQLMKRTGLTTMMLALAATTCFAGETKLEALRIQLAGAQAKLKVVEAAAKDIDGKIAVQRKVVDKLIQLASETQSREVADELGKAIADLERLEKKSLRLKEEANELAGRIGDLQQRIAELLIHAE